MATSDRFNIELTAGNKDRIAVEPWNGRVSIFVVDGSGSVEGEAHVVMEPPECDALIAAIGRALGRPTPTSPRYAPSEDLRFIEPICAALALQCATQEEALDAITKAMQDYRAKAVKLALEQTRPMVVVLDGAAHGEQGATVPRAGVARVLAIHAQIAETNLGEYRDGLIDLLLSELDKVRAGIDAPAPITVTVRRHKNDFRVYASYVKNRSVVVIDEYPGSWRVLSVTGDGEECIVKLESWHADTAATLEAAGLWPVAAPGGER